ncbi:MAG: toll/interleukin-1 receptor domain-containing protein [Synergistaceae bacterium]|nr:toll/interleukin-1 receptor domain-containing protein [Synergistaceae bacterium]
MAGEIFDYFAFISYSHEDKEIAQKLQKRLERYHMPAKLLQAHPELPKKLSPIFRDESDISGKGTLIETLHDNLRRSQYLILICSPSSAKSVYVNDEVKYLLRNCTVKTKSFRLLWEGFRAQRTRL